MFADVSQRDLSTEILGQSLSMPMLIAPMAFQCLARPEGELTTARAAAELGARIVLSTLSTKSLEQVALAGKFSSQNLLWFQLYIHRDRAIPATW